MIPTNLEASEGELAATQWRRPRKDETKKTSLELDAATRRALGSWAAVEIVSDTTPVFPRPNSSFLHGFFETRIINNSSEGVCPPKASSEGVPRIPSEGTSLPKAPPNSLCLTKCTAEGTSPKKTPPQVPPKCSPESAFPPKIPTEGPCPTRGLQEGIYFPNRYSDTSNSQKKNAESLYLPKKPPKSLPSILPPKHPTENPPILKEKFPSRITKVAEEGPPVASSEASVDGLAEGRSAKEKLLSSRKEEAEEEGSEDGLCSSRRLTGGPPSASKKPSFRVARRRDSRRKESRRCSKVASLASKFDAMVMESSKGKVQRTLSQKGSVGPRKRKVEVEVCRRGRRRVEEGRSEHSAGTSVKETIRMFEGREQLSSVVEGGKEKSDEVVKGKECKEVEEIKREVMKDEEEREVKHNEKEREREVENNKKEKDREVKYNEKEKEREVKYNEKEKERELKYNEKERERELKYNEKEKEREVKLNAIEKEREVNGSNKEYEIEDEEDTEAIELMKEEEKLEEVREMQRKVEDEEGGYELVGTMPPPMKPNSSFLWGDGLNGERSLYGGRPGYATVMEEDCYDDVGPPVMQKEEVRVDGAYDVVRLPETLAAEMVSVSDCYESIYIGGDGRVPESRGGSGSDSFSGIEVKSNSLYGRCGSMLSDDGGSCSSEGIAVHEVLSYQLTSVMKGHELERRSETSDEWVDVDASTDDESTGTAPLFCERMSRGRRSPKWSKKVRREWSSRSRKSKEALEVETEQHHYETLYEMVGEAAHMDNIPAVEPEVVPTQRQHALPYENLSDEEYSDSFDSDVTAEFDDQVPTKELPSIPNEMPKSAQPLGDAPLPGANSNGLTKKMAKVAGKKMQELRKNWTMRKHDISRSIKQMSKRRPSEATIPGMTSHPQPPLPPTPDCEAPALPPPRTTSVPKELPCVSMPTSMDPPPLNKSVSSGNLTGRKYWSFKSRFGRRQSSSTSSLQNCSSPSSSPSSSTFYLTEAVNVDTGLKENIYDNQKQWQSASPEKSSDGPSRLSIASEERKPKEERKRVSIGSGKPPVNRRLSVRPQGPPPPPPNTQNGATKSLNLPYGSPSSASSSSSSSSPYAFTSPTTSWYIDVDLLNSGVLDHTSNGRITESSDSSSSAVASREGSVIHGQFTDEPLYQFYAASVAEKVTRDLSEDFDSDGYEEIRDLKSQMQQRPKAMDLVHHKEGCRTLWCQIPEVLGSGLLDQFNSHQKKIQEAKFEVITSEASYLKSLDILYSHFLEAQVFKDENLLSKADRNTLFSNVLPVKQCSEKFLAELERCWQEDILLQDICEIIYHHAEKYFGVYVKYCSNQVHLDRALHRLKKSSQFLEALSSLEAHPVCQSLSLHSFLMLPMQRVTRLPLLVDAILRRMPSTDPHYEICQVALATLNKVVQDCNEGARQAERLEEMRELCQQLDFREVGSPSLLTGGRWLVRKGELIHLFCRDDFGAHSNASSSATPSTAPSPSISTSKLTFGRRMTKHLVFLFLFTDLLVITKKKSENHYLVLDYCPRNLVEVVAEGKSSIYQLPPKYAGEAGRNIFLLSMLQNHDGKTIEMILSTPQESEKERWLQVFTPASSSNPDEQVYEEWDCPQVAAIHPYVAQQPDELSLDPSDVVNVLRKLADGWYLGERIRDGEKGWFPANHCSQIMSTHVRAKNLRQRYRLLALSGDYLDQQRKKKSVEKAAKKKKKHKKESKKE